MEGALAAAADARRATEQTDMSVPRISTGNPYRIAYRNGLQERHPGMARRWRDGPICSADPA